MGNKNLRARQCVFWMRNRCYNDKRAKNCFCFSNSKAEYCIHFVERTGDVKDKEIISAAVQKTIF